MPTVRICRRATKIFKIIGGTQLKQLIVSTPRTVEMSKRTIRITWVRISIGMLTIAGGLTSTADAKSIRLLRTVVGTQRRAEIKLNLQDVLAGRANDFPIMPDDVVYVPKSKSFGATAGRVMMTAGPALGTALLLGVFRR